MTLRQLRKRIDALDLQILRLLNQRARLSAQVGKIKKKRRLPILDSEREKRLLRRLIQNSRGPISMSSIHKIFSEILRHSRQLQISNQR